MSRKHTTLDVDRPDSSAIEFLLVELLNGTVCLLFKVDRRIYAWSEKSARPDWRM
jgi:hypothetical protein